MTTHAKLGDYLVYCDRTGFKVYASDCRMQWDGLFVREKSWEARNQQEFLRGVPDLQAVSTPRPEPGDISTDDTPIPITPSVPATGVAQVNTNAYPVTVVVSGGTVTSILINQIITNVTSGIFNLNNKDSIVLNYSSAPTWQWSFGANPNPSYTPL